MSLLYPPHCVIDQDTGVILGAAVSQAHGRAEFKVATTLLERMRDHPLSSKHPHLYLDRGYRDGEFLADFMDSGYLPHVRLPDIRSEAIPGWKRSRNRLDWMQERVQKVRVARAHNILRGPARESGAALERARVLVEHTFVEAEE